VVQLVGELLLIYVLLQEDLGGGAILVLEQVALSEVGVGAGSSSLVLGESVLQLFRLEVLLEAAVEDFQGAAVAHGLLFD
jgi:hypothetical protein